MQHSGAARRICVCLDDFGLSTGINEAALKLVELGRLNAVGCMVGASAFQVGAADLCRLPAGCIDIGLHLDLTETPLLAGSRRTLRGLLINSSFGRLDRVSLQVEIRSQLDAFEQAFGRAPDFVDGHQHVHQFRGIRDELLAELGRRRGSVKPWLRSTRGAGGEAGWRNRFKPALIARLGAAPLTAAARQRGYPQNERLLGVYDFAGGTEAYASHLARWLRQARDGDLLMCHAGSGHAPQDPIAAARVAEFEVLGSERFARWLAEQQIDLMTMSRILDRR